jgi:hypothetical protein
MSVRNVTRGNLFKFAAVMSLSMTTIAIVGCQRTIHKSAAAASKAQIAAAAKDAAAKKAAADAAHAAQAAEGLVPPGADPSKVLKSQKDAFGSLGGPSALKFTPNIYQAILEDTTGQKRSMSDADLLADQAKATAQAQITPPAQAWQPTACTASTTGLKTAQIAEQTEICHLLQHALDVNEALFMARLGVERLEAQLANKQTLDATAAGWLAEEIADFGLPANASTSDILKRIDTVPVALIIAQAGEESAWETSTAFTKGNNLFNIMGKSNGKNCIDNTIAVGQQCLRAFKNANNSVGRYLLYMNSSDATSAFRDARATMRNPAQGTAVTMDPAALATSVHSVSDPTKAIQVSDVTDIATDLNNEKFTNFLFNAQLIQSSATTDTSTQDPTDAPAPADPAAPAAPAAPAPPAADAPAATK